MALPKVTPGSYSYGAYANPQQVKLADTSAIGKGLEKAAAGVTRALDIQRQEEAKKADQERADKIRKEGYDQQKEMTKLSSDLAEGRDIRKSQRQEARAERKEFKQEFRDVYQLGLKLDSLNAKSITDKTMKSASEYIQSIKNNKELSYDEKMATLGAAEDNFEEMLETHNLIRTISGNKSILDVPPGEILSEEGRILQGIAKSGIADVVALSDYDGAGLGAEYTFRYTDENGVEKPISLPAYEIKNLINNADKNFEVKHVFGTQEDLASVNEFVNVYDKSNIKLDPLYYGPEGKFNEEEFVNMLMNDEVTVAKVAGTRSAASLYKTISNGEQYEPNNTKHKERVAKYYAEAALKSIKIKNPGIFDSMPKTETGTETLNIEDYKGLNQSEKKTELTKELKRRAATGDISILKGYEKFKGLLWDGEKYVDKEDEDIVFYPSEIVEEFIDGSKTWQADSELGIFKKPQGPNKYDQFIINE